LAGVRILIEIASMSSEVVGSTNYESAKGLPPVAPPSGKFILQLFLVPGLIVVVAVLLLVGVSWLVGGESTPEALLQRLDDPNEQVRWRAANEIAQRLTRDNALASNPKVALRLTSLLRQAIDDLNRADKGVREGEPSKEKQTLLAKRKQVEFLCSCVGNLILPTGAPLLNELALRKQGGDLKSAVLLRRQAVWALAKLGDNVHRFDKLTAEQKEAVLDELRGAAAGSWAQQAHDYLDGTQPNIGVVDALAQCADTARDPIDDPFLRELTVQALTFWPGGDAAEKALAEKTLVTLAHDNGHGVRIELGDND
jgi:HEAT repeat protein